MFHPPHHFYPPPAFIFLDGGVCCLPFPMPHWGSTLFFLAYSMLFNVNLGWKWWWWDLRKKKTFSPFGIFRLLVYNYSKINWLTYPILGPSPASVQDVPEPKMVYTCGMSHLLRIPLLRADSHPAFSISLGMNVWQASSYWQSLKSEPKWGKWAGTNSSGLCRKQESEFIDLCSSSFSLSPSEVSKAIKREESTHRRSPSGTHDSGYCEVFSRVAETWTCITSQF